MQNGQIYEKVDERYAAAARSDDPKYSQRVAKEFGYSTEELESIPQDANLGLSCGNPHALANLKEGETVCDLGSGAGFDVFLAAKKVGTSGRAIGVDMNQEMLKRATEIKNKNGAANVSFVESRISNIALPDGLADCVISNCVINLVPEEEKPAVFNEIFRLLKPGGRMAVSDILAKKELPPHVRNNMALYVGCIAGASQVGQYERYLADAGFKDVLIVNTNSDLNVYGEGDGSSGCGTGCCSNAKVINDCCDRQAQCGSSGCGTGCCSNSNGINGCCDSQAQSASAPVPNPNIDFNEFAGSFKIYAVK